MKTIKKLWQNNPKINFILYFLLTFGILGCSKDDGPEPVAVVESTSKEEVNLSDAKEITSFVFLLTNNPIDVNVIATINEENKTITATMPVRTAITALLPEVQLSDLAKVDRTTVQNFTEPLEYTVTAEDGSEVIYMVTISNHIGTYMLTSILSSNPLDPNVSGTFDVDELIDNIDCCSSVASIKIYNN